MGVPHSKLKELQEGNILAPTLDYWLSGNTDVPITWESVVRALESNYVKEGGCANKIKVKYCQNQEPKDEGKG